MQGFFYHAEQHSRLFQTFCALFDFFPRIFQAWNFKRKFQAFPDSADTLWKRSCFWIFFIPDPLIGGVFFHLFQWHCWQNLILHRNWKFYLRELHDYNGPPAMQESIFQQVISDNDDKLIYLCYYTGKLFKIVLGDNGKRSFSKVWFALASSPMHSTGYESSYGKIMRF